MTTTERTPKPEEQVNGLSTPALSDGEFMDALADLPAPKKPLVMELIANLEVEMDAYLAKLRKEDDELVAQIEALQKDLQGALDRTAKAKKPQSSQGENGGQ